MANRVVEIETYSWRKALHVTLEGKVKRETGNAVILLTHGDWRGCLAYDEFADRIYWAMDAPVLDEEALVSPKKGEEVCDRHAVYVAHWFGVISGISFSKESMVSAIDAAAHMNSTCPPRVYLKSLKWDGVKRLPEMFAKYFGAEQTEYGASVATWWMISAVARMLEPGCKADCILILQGKQGAKKSSALHVLGGEWYSNHLPDLSKGSDAALAMSGSWIIELGELEAMSRSTETAFKDFSARTFDKFRKPYGHFFITRPRTAVFAGTTNEDKILKDATGARRFWPVKVGDIDLPALRRDRDQLWAEALDRFDAGEQWWPTTALQDTVASEQDDRFHDDVWAIPIAKWLAEMEAAGGGEFTTAEILTRVVGVEPAKHGIIEGTRVGKILRRLGYDATGRRVIGGRKFSIYETRKAELKLSPQREPGEEG